MLRRRAAVLASCLLLIVAFQTTSAEVTRLSDPTMTCDAFEVFGAPLDSTLPGQSLKDLLAQGPEVEGKEVRVTTRVAKICQKKGCFFIAQEGAAQARVTFADYGFFLPTDTGGKTVTLVGTLKANTLTAEQAAHYAQDLGEDPVPDGPVTEHQIVATSVLVPKG